MLPEPPARRSKFYYYFGKIKKGKVILFWEKFSSPQSVSHWANAVRSVRVGRGFDFPLVQCRSVSCVWACVFWVSPVGLSWISWAFVLRFRSSACTACVYHSFECTFGPTVARSISPASVALSFYVSVLLHVPHASITLLSALSAPLSLGRSLLHQLRFRFTFPFFCMYRMRLSLFWVHFWPHCRSVGLSVPFEKGSSGSFGFTSTVAR